MKIVGGIALALMLLGIGDAGAQEFNHTPQKPSIGDIFTVTTNLVLEPYPYPHGETCNVKRGDKVEVVEDQGPVLLVQYRPRGDGHCEGETILRFPREYRDALKLDRAQP